MIPPRQLLLTALAAVCVSPLSARSEDRLRDKARGGQFKDWMHALAISADQSMVAAADIAGCVHVWQRQTQR